MYILVLNEKNIVPDGQNNKMIYRFPGSVNLKNKYIAVSSISMYYSWFNVTTTSRNNTLTYTWTAGATTTTYTITIPDGLYEISAINNYCQFVMIQNATYWIDNTSGDYYYPFEILVNSSRYAIQLNTYLIPTSLPAGTSIPAGFPGWPTTTQNSVVTFPELFNLIVGYQANFASDANLADAYVPPNPSTKEQNFVAKNGLGTLSYLSSRAPQVQPNNNVLFSISNINNDYAQPSSIIYSLNPNVGIGEQINERPPNFMWNKLIDGTYNELRLAFLGTDLRPLTINDPNMTILLTIRDKEESYIT